MTDVPHNSGTATDAATATADGSGNRFSEIAVISSVPQSTEMERAPHADKRVLPVTENGAVHETGSESSIATLIGTTTATITDDTTTGDSGQYEYESDDDELESPLTIKANAIAAKLELVDLVDDDPTQPKHPHSHSKLPNPITTANPVSYLLWIWVTDLFRVGKRKQLTHDDLYRVPTQDESRVLYSQWQRSWQRQLTDSPNQCPSVWRCLFDVFGWRFLWRGAPLALVSMSKIAQPLLLKQLVLLLQANEAGDIGSQGPDGIGYLYAILLAIACLLQSLIQHQYFFNVYRTGGQMRILLSTAIYQQALSLRTTHFLKTSTGKLTNLIASDTSKLEEFAIYGNYTWNAVVEAAVVLGLLIDLIGVSALVGFGALVCMVPIQTLFSHLFSHYRKQAVRHTDTRVKTVNEILTGSEVIKLYSYEPSLEKVVKTARENEFSFIRRAALLKALNQAIFFFSSPLISLLTFITYHSLGHTLSPADLFAVVAFFNVVRLPITSYLTYSVQATSEANVAVKRIQQFMELGFSDQEKVVPNIDAHAHIASVSEPPGTVKLTNASFKWDTQSKELASLFDLTFEAPRSQLTAIIGPIGSCKSSLLCALLGEMTRLSGQSSVIGRLAYAPQNAWIFTGTVRENILMNRPMNRDRYLRTLYSCCLVDDIALLQAGDLTTIGERGVNLSGGQKARVSLARAVYGDADVYLLDDALAALDSMVARKVFHHVASDRGLLVGKTRLLITHQTHFLHAAKHLVLLDNGRIQAQGSWQEMTNRPELSAIFRADHKTEKPEKTARLRKKVVSAAAQPPLNAHTEEPVTVAAVTASCANGKTEHVSITVDPVKKNVQQSIVSDEVSVAGTVGWSVYMQLFRQGSRLFGLLYAFFVVVVLMVIGQGVSITSDRWLARWAGASAEDQKKEIYVDTWIALVLATIFLSIIRADLFFRLILNGARSIHDRMFVGVLYSSMRWFESNPHGRVLNRFSKDQGIVDDNLPLTMFDALQTLVMSVGAIAAVASVAPYILIIVVPLIPIFLFTRQYYLNTSRQLKRLDAVSRSPVYAYFSSTLNGLIPIRAFGVTKDFSAEFHDRVDHNTSSVFMFYCTTRWFGVRLDAICVLLVLATSLLMVGLKDTISASEAGFALAYSLLLTSLFQWGVRQSAECENQMTSVERIIEYGELPREGAFTHSDDPSLTVPPPSWPNAGSVSFNHYSMRYRPGLPLVHRNLNFAINSGEKIGICGRTGAGKSSLFQALFRLVHRDSGDIVIDGINIFDLPLHTLRSSLAVIPQIPVIFSNTLRFNLDPFNEFTDEQIWAALRSVQLDGMVNKLHSKLDTMMSEGGSNFSVGETQLVCVARALLKPSRVLCIDEATANVDLVTDQQIQEIIRTEFRDRTVLTIAHRLQTIVHCDKIAVLDKGECVEFDSPRALLAKEHGLFRSMWEAAKQSKGH